MKVVEDAAMAEWVQQLPGAPNGPAHDEDRWLLLGQEPHGCRLALIFTRRGERLRPISCRPMRANERKVYETARQEDQ